MMFTAPTLRKALTLAGFITGLWQCSHSRLTVAVWFLIALSPWRLTAALECI